MHLCASVVAASTTPEGMSIHLSTIRFVEKYLAISVINLSVCSNFNDKHHVLPSVCKAKHYNLGPKGPYNQP